MLNSRQYQVSVKLPPAPAAVKLILGTLGGFLTPTVGTAGPAVLAELPVAAGAVVGGFVPITNGSLDGIGLPSLVWSFTTFWCLTPLMWAA